MKTQTSLKKKGLQTVLVLFLGLIMISQGYSQTCSKTAKADKSKKPCMAIEEAVVKGNLEKISHLIKEKGLDVNTRLKNEQTMLTHASWNGHTDMVKFLLKNGADATLSNKWNHSPLHDASAQGHNDIVSILLKVDPNINQAGQWGFTPLHVAVRNQHPKTVELLLENKADVNKPDEYKRPAIILASWSGNAEVIKSLIAHGADVNASRKSGNSVLHNLAYGGYTEALKLVLANGANANMVDENGHLPIHAAAQNGKYKSLKALLASTKNINSQEKTSGNTVLHMACINGDLESVKVLIEAKANDNLANTSGKKAIDYAIKYGHIKTLAYLNEKGLASKDELAMAWKAKENATADLGTDKAKVTYTGHSGWVVQTENSYVVFDYWNKHISTEKCLSNGAICPEEMKDKNLYVLVSHAHGDHFDTCIYDWANKVKNITYVYGFDPKESWLYKKRKYNGPEYISIANNQTQKVKDLTVTTLKSNDTGQGFLVEVDGVSMYHPGDHALFTEEDKPDFKKEVDFIASKTQNVDIAFLPVSGCPSRWKKEFIVEGFFYQIDQLNPKTVYPMHAFNREYTLKEFAELANDRKTVSQIVCAENKGDNFNFSEDAVVVK